MKHRAVLEGVGLIARAKNGRVVRCELDAAPLQEAATLMFRYERFWTERLDASDVISTTTRKSYLGKNPAARAGRGQHQPSLPRRR